MPDATTFVTFIFAALVLSVTPGPDMALLVSRGLSQGWKSAWLTAFGFTLAGVVQVPLLALGVASLVRSFPLAFDVLRYAGAAYLIWRGIKLIRMATGYSARHSSGAARSCLASLGDGFVASLTNPKVVVFLLAFLPQFVDHQRGSVTLQLIVLGITLKLVALAVETIIALSAAALGQALERWRRLTLWQERLTGAVLIGLGLRLLTMEIRTK
ncbi:LysE family translocator [Aquamicrobium sp. NLF2-7]|uniref:LysE family translocator n=1 Tax=Aquamicrobium sp. NLF2-7 TaxID=2918753 RepID=UPI001EFA9DC3|nr:LysE family translocator [Aquamicrobium sp. NLF2-7]MCG8274678.1 LysE family translocator [Aquamicrobium sp. NLF2-7]